MKKGKKLIHFLRNGKDDDIKSCASMSTRNKHDISRIDEA